MPASLAIVVSDPATTPGPLPATVDALASRCRACGLLVTVVASADLAQAPLTDAYWHVGLTADAVATVLHGVRSNRPTVVHALGPEVEVTITQWPSWPALQVVRTSATRFVAAAPRAQTLLRPWCGQVVTLLPTLPRQFPPPPRTADARRELGLPAEGLLVAVADVPRPERLDLLLTTFAEVWDTRQDAWLVLAGDGMGPAVAAAIADWARLDPQPARRVVSWQPRPGQSPEAMIVACDQLWCLPADFGPTPAWLTAVQAGIPIVAATDGGHNPLPAAPDTTPEPWLVTQDVAALTFASLARLADPTWAKAQTTALAARLPAVYGEAGLEEALRGVLTDLGLLPPTGKAQSGNKA